MDHFGSVYELHYLPMQFFSVVQQPISGLESISVEFLYQKKLYTYTPGRTPLDE